MEENTPLTTRFYDKQNRIDDAMFARNTFGPQGAKRFEQVLQ